MKIRVVRNIIHLILCSIAILFIILINDTFRENKVEKLEMIEIVDDVKLDSVFDTKYVVKIKRLEVVENYYYLHTDKQLKPGTIHSKGILMPPSSISYNFKLAN